MESKYLGHEGLHLSYLGTIDFHPKYPGNQRGKATRGSSVIPSVREKEKIHIVLQKMEDFFLLLDCEEISHWSYFKQCFIILSQIHFI